MKRYFGTHLVDAKAFRGATVTWDSLDGSLLISEVRTDGEHEGAVRLSHTQVARLAQFLEDELPAEMAEREWSEP